MSNRWWLGAVLVVLIAGCGKKESAQTSTPANKVEITSPVGFVWKWEGTQTPVELIQPVDPTKYTVEFLPDTSVVAQVDCNRGKGKFKMDGRRIAIGPLAITKMACPEGTLDAKFVQQLEAARHIFFRGDTLYMDLFADSGTMRFSQMAEPPKN